MEGVEDIPGSALAERLAWGWTSFGEYLDALEATHRILDVGTQIARGPLRAFAMGDRGAAGGGARVLHEPHADPPFP